MSAFLSRLPLRGKLALIAAMSLLMLLIPTALYALRALQSLQQLQHEVQGLQPGAEILQTTRLAAQHRGLSNGALNGDAKAAAQRAEAWTALQALRAPSMKTLQGLGDTALDQRLADFWREQQALAEAVAARSVPAPESFARHTKLIEQQLALLYDLTVRSELVLHPVAVGYFLQDAALNHLPLLTELLGRVRGSGMGLLAKGALTPADRMRLAILVERAEQAAAGAQRAVTLAGQDDAATSKALSDVLAGAQAALAETTAAARKQLIEPESPGLDAAAWWATTTRTIDAHFKLGDAALALLQADLQAAVASEQRTLATASAALLLLAGLGGWLLLAVARQTTHSIEQAIGLAQAVAAGDLTHRVAVAEGARDEGAQLIQALGLMSSQLGAVVGAVRDNAGQVATASAEIAQGNQDLSSRTESQASALQQTAASMEELRTTIGHSADSARQASQLAHSASEVASRGGLAVGEVAATMLQIKQSSHRIAEIIGTIDGIAFQTNILALNAAVEAARAGEQGRGFAVVASEVRALAQRSASAAREIRTLISASVERVEQGSQQGADAAATMAEVVQSVKRVAGLIGEVSAATQEQNGGVAQVTEAVTQMDHVTQQNAALVEEGAAAAESLRQQADALLQAVAVFRGAGHAAA